MTPTQHDDTAAPECPRCHSGMTISRIMPGEPGRETRTYRCQSCGEEVTQAARIDDRPS